MSDNQPSSPAALTFERTDNFVSLYANNAVFEATAWDLKIIFGQLDQLLGPKLAGEVSLVRQHVAITIPWAQAKLALYWLRLQVEATEIQQGKISIRKDLIPPEPPPLSGDDLKNPDSVKIHELVWKLREEFIANL